MSQPIITRPVMTWITRCCLLAAILTSLSVVAQAQTSSATDGSTPAGMAPGAPAGSYQLSGFDNINFFNGNLNFNLPLLNIGGRGSVHDSIGLKIEQKWRTFKQITGNTSWAEPVGWESLRVGYGPGMMIGRLAGIPTSPSCTGDHNEASLLRLTFKVGDGTEYELHDTLHNGESGFSHYIDCTLWDTTSRGREFVSSDGSSTTFISDGELFDAYSDMRQELFPSGYLLLRDGTRYRIDVGKVMWIRDRNGNKMVFEYSGDRVSKITDSLGRVVNLSYVASSPTPYGDTITYQGTGGTTRTITVWHDRMSTAMRSDFAQQSFYDLFSLNGNANDGPGTFNPVVVTSVQMPNNKFYQFKYNSYGELARVDLPTGGAFEYDYDGGLAYHTPGTYGVVSPGSTYLEIYRRVVERRVFGAGSTIPESRMTISKPEENTNNVGYAVVDNLAGNTLLTRERHYYYGSAKVNGFRKPTDYEPWKTGREWKTEVLDISGQDNALRRSEQTWDQASTYEASRADNPQIIQTVNTLLDTNQVSKKTFAYDQFHNRSDVYEYDFGSAGALMRHSHTEFLTSPDYTSTTGAYLLGLPTQQSVFDSAGIERARTTFEYDNYAIDTNHAAIQTYPRPGHNEPAISGLDEAFNSSSSNLARGNATATSHYLLSSSGMVLGLVSGYAQYDIAGNVWKAIDARGYATTIEYSDCFGGPNGNAHDHSQPPELSSLGQGQGQASYAFATVATNALNQKAYSQFDYYLGRAVDGEDANGVVSSTYSTDSLDRPTQVIRAANQSAAMSQTTISYDDTNHVVTTTSDQTAYNDNALKSKTIYDSLGRTTETRQYEGGTNYIAVQTEYDALGRAYKNSQPLRPLNLNSETPAWTTAIFDPLGRIVSVTTPDGAAVNSYYNGTQTMVRDQAGKERMSQTNALGQLTDVWEITSADESSEEIAFPNRPEVVSGYRTKYAYDALGNLITVIQQKGTSGTTQTRSFAYNSLSQLLAATNPESGTVNYTYDENGNLTHKTDARLLPDQTHLVTTYEYDALNRLKTRSYTDGVPPGYAGQTPAVTYTYDSPDIANGKGRLASVASSVSNYSYTSYDVMGRVLAGTQTTDGTAYPMSYGYNLAGEMTSQTYPSGREVTTAYDTAGRLSQVVGQQSGQANKTYADSFGYWSAGAIKDFRLGNNLWEHTILNSRLQISEIGLGTTQGGVDRLRLNYDYGTTTNNANPQSQTITLSGLTLLQSYSYDELNRLKSATEMNGTTPSWTQTFSYDRFGNRRFDVSDANTTTLPQITPQNESSTNPAISPANNRISADGYRYDAAGNLECDPTHPCGLSAPEAAYYEYDAENRMKTAGGSSTYSYDGDGRRVKKVVGPGATIFVYDIGGQLLAEYSDTQEAAVGGTTYLTSDQLGTPRVTTKADGSISARHDYQPFGEEVSSAYGGRATVSGYDGGDSVRQKFTSKERDHETGLDYFLARYYSSALGRFTSVDPANAGSDPGDPQSWSGYGYARNNPLAYSDPDGLKYTVCDSRGENCVEYNEKEFNKLKKGGPAEGYSFKNGNIYYNGELTGTYSNSCLYCESLVTEMARRGPASEKIVAVFVVTAAVIGVTGGAGAYLVTPYLAPTITTLALRAAPVLPVVPTAIDKLNKIGVSIQQANAIVQSPTSQKLIDNDNNANINVIQEVGGKLVRITLDPKAERIISAGIVRANQIANGITRGRFVKKG